MKIKLILTYTLIVLLWIPMTAQNSGPDYVKNTLTSAGVFNTPTYSFTTAYDAYQVADNINGLFIDALDYGGNPTKVFCWYGVPENLQAGEKAPAVVLVHGGGGTAFPDWVKQWTDRGYIAIAIAHEGQLPGEKDPWYPTWEYSGPRRAGFFRDADNAIGEQWFYHAVADAILANSLLRSFPEVDADQIGINGISWGGILTNVITGIDDRFKFSIPVYGCGYLDESPKYSVDMALNSQAELDFYFANWEPSLYIPNQKLPVFYVNGNNDKQFAMNIATPTYNLISSEKYLRIEHLMAHSTAAGYAPEEIYDFADYMTNNGDAPLSISVDDVTGNTVTASYQGQAKSAVLYYTTYVGNWEQGSYTWLEAPVNLNTTSNEITADIPNGTKYFYINVTSTEDFMYSSPMEEFIQEVAQTGDAIDVHIQAEENTTYSSGAITMTGIGSVPGYDTTFEVNITVTPNGDFTTYPSAVIVSGTSDNNGTSSSKSWAISDDGLNQASGDRVFVGDQKFSATIDNAALGTITGTSGLTSANFNIDTFKAITIVNGHNVGDRFTFSADGSADYELGRFSGEASKEVDLLATTATSKVESFTIKNGSEASNDKWAVQNIIVQVTVDLQTLGLSKGDPLKSESFRLFPNPASSQITFNMPIQSAKILDITGKVVKTYTSETKSLNVSDLESGIYFLKGVSTEGKIITKKFIKGL
ncbi:T9SS type A sorting domain-containing protein [Tamlana agarivorans]|uniref:T9SS type A sorting domain-containing protein n=1 Tax=Pseudotamlana agarivorans TaxID=481183 RepID=A0ACC5U9A7_9FLAO|nr:T9SS type A sorting domain-containing protein [Tamlana agarivorans]MBU2950913.1 T9SS type A sorting domain-containing protein [Tamlana agarivorans]